MITGALGVSKRQDFRALGGSLLHARNETGLFSGVRQTLFAARIAAFLPVSGKAAPRRIRW